MAALWMIYKIRCNPMCTLLWCTWTLCQCGIDRCFGRTSVHLSLLAEEPHNTTWFLFPCQYLCRTILVTTYSKVCDWGVSRAGSMPFYWLSCSLPFCPPVFPFSSFIIWVGIVRWGLRTDRVLIALSQPSIASLFFIIIIIIIHLFAYMEMFTNVFAWLILYALYK